MYGMASVAFEHVCKTYPNGHRALTDCNLQIDDGELIVLVGPSGCGKSTLLRALAGLERVESGTIRIGDQIANELSPQQRNIAMVFQDYALYPTMTVRGNLEFPLKMRKLDRAECQRRIARVAELLDLGELLGRLPKQLSGGQRQRVAMGRALVRDPSVFLLDEPLSNLDAKLRVQVRAEIVELQRRTGTTMIYVTHDQVEAMTMGHRIAVLKAGELQQVGEPRVLYEQPTNTFVAGFIGTPPMNLLPASLLRRLTRSTAAQESRPWLTGSGQEPSESSLGSPESAAQTAGIRPEHLSISDDTSGLPALIVQLEYLGHETLVYFRLEHGDVTTTANPLALRMLGSPRLQHGQAIRVAMRPGAIRWFDAQGKALPR